MQKTSGPQGFTLLELSMVLAIVALILGVIMVGSSMIQNARLQRVITEVEDTKKAIKLFKDKYLALPGDMANAEAIWGSDAACPNTAYTATPHTVTCNGNGDGYIGGPDGASNYYEWYRAWQQLMDAKLISGAYSGTNSGITYTSFIGINVPASKVKGAGYTLAYQQPSNGTTTVWAGNYGHRLIFGAAVNKSDTHGPILSPADAYSIDAKMDDGLPAYGIVMTSPSTVYPNCTTSDTASSSKYNFSKTGTTCALLFMLGF